MSGTADHIRLNHNRIVVGTFFIPKYYFKFYFQEVSITGMRLAEELGIHYYDEEILKMTSETSAIGEQYFRLADEKAGNNLLYRTVTNMKPELSAPVKDGHRLTSPENLFRFQVHHSFP